MRADVSINGRRVQYIDDDPATSYGKALNAAASWADLIAAIEPYREIAADALDAANRYATERPWEEWAEGLRLERRRRVKGAGQEWQERYAVILLPEVMLVTSLTAHHFHAPWGTAFIRLCEFGELRYEDGRYVRGHEEAVAEVAG